jgi:hypothetical protein
MAAETMPTAEQLDANVRFSRARDKQVTADRALCGDATEDNELASMEARLAMLKARLDTTKTDATG